jgi:hypothetical protein
VYFAGELDILTAIGRLIKISGSATSSPVNGFRLSAKSSADISLTLKSGVGEAGTSGFLVE